MPVPSRFYRVLIKLYPARFREEFGEPLERQFWDEYGQAGSAPARAIFLLRAFADLAATIPAEILRELLQDLRYAAASIAGAPSSQRWPLLLWLLRSALPPASSA